MTQLNLHKIEKKILLSLVNDDKIEIEKLATLTNLSLDNVRRGIEWLKYKGIGIHFYSKGINTRTNFPNHKIKTQMRRSNAQIL